MVNISNFGLRFLKLDASGGGFYCRLFLKLCPGLGERQSAVNHLSGFKAFDMFLRIAFNHFRAGFVFIYLFYVNLGPWNGAPWQTLHTQS